jgi:hypothetical protein
MSEIERVSKRNNAMKINFDLSPREQVSLSLDHQNLEAQVVVERASAELIDAWRLPPSAQGGWFFRMVGDLIDNLAFNKHLRFVSKYHQFRQSSDNIHNDLPPHEPPGCKPGGYQERQYWRLETTVSAAPAPAPSVLPPCRSGAPVARHIERVESGFRELSATTTGRRNPFLTPFPDRESSKFDSSEANYGSSLTITS